MNKSCHAELVSASHDKDPKKEKNKAPANCVRLAATPPQRGGELKALQTGYDFRLQTRDTIPNLH